MAKHQRVERKSSSFYLVVVGAWVALMAAFAYSTAPLIADAFGDNPVLGSLVLLTAAFIGYFWLNGLKDLAYTLYYHLWMKYRLVVPPFYEPERAPRVALVYCTYNDFNADSLYASMHQDYPNFVTVILDDSTEAEYSAQVDAFAAEHQVEIVRRRGNAGFKAGNLNNYLRSAQYEFFVILDSDEIIPRNFVRRALDYFAATPGVGIVQANHRATRNRTAFMRKFARGVDSHWPTYQAVKDRHGFMSLLGHGAMVSRACYEAAGGFPHVVAEDISFSIAARRKGFRTVFAPDIVCEEEYPPDYLAFKTRHAKWTEGNMEFIRKYTSVILTGNLTWYEKLDIILFTYSLPLTGVFSVYVVVNAMVLPAIGYVFPYPLWMLAPTLLFLVAPMLNDIVTYRRRMANHALASYLLHATLLYGSMYYVSLRTSVKSVFGKPRFNVTPKDAVPLRFGEVLRLNAGELVFGVVLAGVVIAVAGSILPVVLLVTPAFFALYLSVLHHSRHRALAASDRAEGLRGPRHARPIP